VVRRPPTHGCVGAWRGREGHVPTLVPGPQDSNQRLLARKAHRGVLRENEEQKHHGFSYGIVQIILHGSIIHTIGSEPRSSEDGWFMMALGETTRTGHSNICM